MSILSFVGPQKTTSWKRHGRALQLVSYEPDSLCLGPLHVKRTCLPKEDLFVYVWEHVIIIFFWLKLKPESVI